MKPTIMLCKYVYHNYEKEGCKAHSPTYQFEVSLSHNCWCGCARCHGAGCLSCDGKGYFDNGRVTNRVSAAWSEPDFSDLEIVDGPDVCECGVSFKGLVEEWLEKWKGDIEHV